MNERIVGKEKKPLPREQVQSPQFSLVKKKSNLLVINLFIHNVKYGIVT